MNGNKQGKNKIILDIFCGEYLDLTRPLADNQLFVFICVKT